MGVLLLDSINQPADLKQLNEKQVEQLCEEIRSFLLKNISKTGGHLASNLGMVELTVALHRVLETPQDKIVFQTRTKVCTMHLLPGMATQPFRLLLAWHGPKSCIMSRGLLWQ